MFYLSMQQCECNDQCDIFLIAIRHCNNVTAIMGGKATNVTAIMGGKATNVTVIMGGKATSVTVIMGV